MKKWLRWWLGIDDVQSVVDVLDARYQMVHNAERNNKSRINSIYNELRNSIDLKHSALISLTRTVNENKKEISWKLSKAEVEGVNEEFRNLEDEFCEFRYDVFLREKELKEKQVLFANFIIGLNSQIRFISKFIGAVAKQKQEVK